MRQEDGLFEEKKGPCGHVRREDGLFEETKRPLRACAQEDGLFGAPLVFSALASASIFSFGGMAAPVVFSALAVRYFKRRWPSASFNCFKCRYF